MGEGVRLIEVDHSVTMVDDGQFGEHEWQLLILNVLLHDLVYHFLVGPVLLLQLQYGRLRLLTHAPKTRTLFHCGDVLVLGGFGIECFC